jgi:hypothetical protein
VRLVKLPPTPRSLSPGDHILNWRLDCVPRACSPCFLTLLSLIKHNGRRYGRLMLLDNVSHSIISQTQSHVLNLVENQNRQETSASFKFSM